MNNEIEKQLVEFQKNEITESLIYERLAAIEKNVENANVLRQIGIEERGHYNTLKRYTGKEIQPNMIRVRWYMVLAKILGLTFTIKWMELGEKGAVISYRDLSKIPDIQALSKDEDVHEQRLIELLNEERLAYIGSVVLGLNDALVEFTGALAGFTLALGEPKLVALTGSITGIAAALSMASSEYLATKSEHSKTKHPLKASVYTGIAYLITVVALVTPFIILNNLLLSLGIMLLMALIIIAVFNFYYSVAKGESFRHRFVEMALLSFGVATISFFIGYLLKMFTGIDA